MADITLNGFRANLKDLARPNRFLMVFTRPFAGVNLQDISFLAKGAALPGRTIDQVEANWQGMTAKIGGDPTFNDFTVTFINDYEMRAKRYIEAWIDFIDTMKSNVRSAPADYVDNGCIVHQLGRNGESLRAYNLVNAWPGDMADIDLNMDSNSQMAEFAVTFKYDYFDVNTSKV